MSVLMLKIKSTLIKSSFNNQAWNKCISKFQNTVIQQIIISALHNSGRVLSTIHGITSGPLSNKVFIQVYTFMGWLLAT